MSITGLVANVAMATQSLSLLADGRLCGGDRVGEGLPRIDRGGRRRAPALRRCEILGGSRCWLALPFSFNAGGLYRGLRRG